MANPEKPGLGKGCCSSEGMEGESGKGVIEMHRSKTGFVSI